MDRKLAVVVGHNPVQQGVLGAPPINMREYEYNLKVARNIYLFARQLGLKCEIFERIDLPSLDEEVKEVYDRVNKWCSDSIAVCVELHFNALDQKTEGSLTLFDEDPEDSLDFAREIHQGTVSLFKRQGKADKKNMLAGDKYGRGLKNLEAMKVTGCICEPFFGDYPKDAALGHSLMFEYARMIAEISARFLTNRIMG